jgi:hypothetical protein
MSGMTTTPAGVTITATKPDGTTEEITEGVQVLYDLLIHSMDWGSFLTIEDVMPVARIAHFCGFKGHEEVDEYIADGQLKADTRKAIDEREGELGRRLTVEEIVEITERLRGSGYPKWT